MIYKKVKIKDLVPYENNPRIIENAIEPVAESIKQVGYISPIIVDENMVVLAGHTRLEAMKRLGEKECMVVVADGLTEEQRKKFRLYDNKAGELAEWDVGLLKEELFDVDFQGYDFGQPVQAKTEEEETGVKKVVCPCCGEEFEVNEDGQN